MPRLSAYKYAKTPNLAYWKLHTLHHIDLETTPHKLEGFLYPCEGTVSGQPLLPLA
jgi:hypothetical protein